MQIIIDIDGTICAEEKEFRRALAVPIKGAKEAVNSLKKNGHTIIFYSARIWAEYEMTIDWLNKHGFLFDQLILGKPQGDVWIDDRAIRFSSWTEVIKEIY